MNKGPSRVEENSSDYFGIEVGFSFNLAQIENFKYFLLSLLLRPVMKTIEVGWKLTCLIEFPFWVKFEVSYDKFLFNQPQSRGPE